MASVDVTVRGAGVFGLSIAWACAARGARVRVVDPLGVGAGASGGLVGALAPHVPEAWNALKQFQFESLVMAGGWWAAVAVAGGVDPGYARTGRVQPLADAAAVEAARARAAGAAAHWGGLADWRVEPAGGAFAPVAATGLVVRDTLTARLSPRGAGRALVAALRARGAEVVAEAEDAGAVVHATGVAGLEALGLDLGRKVGGGVKGQAAAFAADAAEAPQVYAGGLHVVPHADGTVAVGSTSETRWATEGVDGQVEDLIARARALVPALSGAEVVERWAGIRPRAVTRQPVLGPWPGRPGQFVANGGFKIGFGMAPKVADVMADLVLEDRDGVPDAMRVEALL
jgi:glycine/D-amino acid oxidase-like deaminating enzyme